MDIFFVITKMDAQLVIHKPVTDVWKISIQLLFYYIDVFMLKNKTHVIIHSLHHINYVEQKQSGSKMDPWSPPQLMRVLSEKLFPTCTLNILLDR